MTNDEIKQIMMESAKVAKERMDRMKIACVPYTQADKNKRPHKVKPECGGYREAVGYGYDNYSPNYYHLSY